MDETERLFLVLFVCIAWCVWCGILSHVLDQPRAADHAATLLGVVLIMWAVQ